MHLPASRDEAWGALKHLVPKEQWDDAFSVYAALESIYRAEYHAVGEDLQRAYKAANDALVEDSPVGDDQEQDLNINVHPAEGSDDEAQPSTSHGSNGSNSSNGAGSKSSTTTNSTGKGQAEGNGSHQNGAYDNRTAFQQDSSSSAKHDGSEPPGQGILQRGAETAQGTAVAVAEEVKEQVLPSGSMDKADDGESHGRLPAFSILKDKIVNSRSGSSSDDSDGSNRSGGQRSVEVAQADVAFEDASRLEYDRRRKTQLAQESHRIDAAAADAAFLRLLVNVVNKGHFLQLSGRDDALSRSLNSDYLAQLYINPDTKCMDQSFAAVVQRDEDLPDEAKSMLVFKRGYGQARKRGRMLVPKLDYLQYIAVKGVFTYAAGQLSVAWKRLQRKTDSAKQAGRDKLQAAGLPQGKDEPSKTSQDSRQQPGQERHDEEEKDESSDDESLDQAAADGTQTRMAQGSAKGEELLEGTARKAQKRLLQGVKDWVSPRVMVAGGGLFMSLSRWGLIPQVDVLPLGDFNRDWAPHDRRHQDPVYVERVSLRDALQGGRPETLLGDVELVEPTFQELMIVYRKTPATNLLSEVRAAIMGDNGKDDGKGQLRRRDPIAIRIYRDIPVPTWRIVFPDKLLQFRPLDGLRADLFSMAGLVAFIAQAKYDNPILEIVTFASAIVLVTRVVLGYKRMYDRFEQMANEMLANCTLAGQEGTLEYLAATAALQQWGQSALALLVLHQAQHPLTLHQLEQQAETLLESEFQVKIHFNANHALSELHRLGQLQQAYEGGASSKQTFSAVPLNDGYGKLKERWQQLLLRDSPQAA